MRDEQLTRGKLAKLSGIHLETVRYYEQRGLLQEPRRSPANYRLYPQDAIRRVEFIKRAQQLGFSLAEVKDLLSLRTSEGAQCVEVSQRARAKLEEIEGKILTLKSMHDALASLVSECPGRGPASDCLILRSLDDTNSTT
jgi:MerR family copper efflux transcriptional regulator